MHVTSISFSLFQEVDVDVKGLGTDSSPSTSSFEQQQPAEGKGIVVESDMDVYDTALTLTPSMVILDDLEDGELMDSPSQSPIQPPREYDTESQCMKFGEDKNDWENMDIKLTIDPSGVKDPVITKAEADPEHHGKKFSAIPSPGPRVKPPLRNLIKILCFNNCTLLVILPLDCLVYLTYLSAF